MRIYIVEDDLSVINILEDIIETQGLGEICGDCGGEPANLSDVLRAKPSSVPVVSCQLIMNNPTTSCPCCLSRYAATDESTPPESPITTRAIVILLFTGRAALRAAPVSSCAPRSRYGR